jgi:hypothetical protein
MQVITVLTVKILHSDPCQQHLTDGQPNGTVMPAYLVQLNGIVMTASKVQLSGTVMSASRFSSMAYIHRIIRVEKEIIQSKK